MTWPSGPDQTPSTSSQVLPIYSLQRRTIGIVIIAFNSAGLPYQSMSHAPFVSGITGSKKLITHPPPSNYRSSYPRTPSSCYKQMT